MSDEEDIASMAGDLLAQNGPGAAATTVTAYLYTQLVHPTVKVTGQAVSEAWRSKLERWFKLSASATEMTPDRMSSAPVHPRVLARSAGEVLLLEDEVQQRYAAGVIASSRREGGGDDRGIAFLAMLENMPSSAVRLHYALYSSIRDSVLAGTVEADDIVSGAWSLDLRHITSLVTELTAVDESWAAVETLALLDAQGLTAPVNWGDRGVRRGPTPLGIRLYIWAHGAVQTELDLTDAEFPAHLLDGPRLPDSDRIFAVAPTARRVL